MLIKRCSDVEPNTDMPGVLKRELITAADGAPRFALRVFEVAPGESTPSHSHWWEHEVYVLSGRGMVLGDQGTMPIVSDNAVFISPEEHHCFVNTGSEPLRFICCIPIEEQPDTRSDRSRTA